MCEADFSPITKQRIVEHCSRCKVQAAERSVSAAMVLQFHIRRMAVIATVLMCLLLASCGEDPTIWSTTARGPDGNRVAVAHTVQHTGPGANGVETIVEIKQTTGWLKRSTMVLGFMNDGASMHLKMKWVTPTHLEVEFDDDPKMLYYQVVRTSGIVISVRDLSFPTSFSEPCGSSN